MAAALLAAAGCGAPSPQAAGGGPSEAAGSTSSGRSSSSGSGYGYGGYGSGYGSGAATSEAGGGSASEAGGASSSEAAGPAPSEGGSSAGAGGASEVASGSEAAKGETVDVDLYEFKIEIGGADVDKSGSLKLRAGRVTFEVKNEGHVTHAFEVKGQGIDVKTKSLGPGESDELAVDLKPGRYEIWCPVDGHRDLGMLGVITVQ
ncbi:MAG: cupredoxin domain-containing protein [Firmicutes bacterium]|nr:cupredoxin domain-containing protein [Bacillota bacterium]